MLSELFQKEWNKAGGGLDQYQLRDRAFREISKEDYADALYEALLNDAYAYILSKRYEKPAKPAPSNSAKPAAAASVPRGKPAGQANARKSSKLAILRERWPMLVCSYSVAHGYRKNLESMTAEECLSAASNNRKLADGNVKRAEWLELIADQQIKHHAATVAKLPAEVLDEIASKAP